MGHTHRKMVLSNRHTLGFEKVSWGTSLKIFVNQSTNFNCHLKPGIVLKDDYHINEVYKDIAT